MWIEFNCDRTCQHREECRFRAFFRKLGSNRVYSNTIKVKAEFSDLEALNRAAVALGAKVLGLGTHSLYSSQEQGFGIHLKGWTHPIIARADGTLAYDDYHGAWGNVSDIKRLTERY